MDFFVRYQAPNQNGTTALHSIVQIVTSEFYLKSREEEMTSISGAGVEVLQFDSIHVSYLPFSFLWTSVLYKAFNIYMTDTEQGARV